MQIRVRNKGKTEEGRRLMGFIAQMEGITHRERRHQDQERRGRWTGKVVWLTGGWGWRACNRRASLVHGGGSLLWKAMQATAKEGHRWRRRIFDKIYCGLWFFLAFAWGDSKDQICFSINFLAATLFSTLHSLFSGAGTGGRSRPGFARVVKGLCLPPAFDQMLWT